MRIGQTWITADCGSYTIPVVGRRDGECGYLTERRLVAYEVLLVEGEDRLRQVEGSACQAPEGRVPVARLSPGFRDA